ncbi:hypothetical protein JCM13304A_17000 [Desulfothermus okinawensis JCM 13304]
MTTYINYFLQGYTSGHIKVKSIKYKFPLRFNIYTDIDNSIKYINTEKNIYVSINPDLLKIGAFNIYLYAPNDKIIKSRIFLDNLFHKPVMKDIYVDLYGLKIASIPIYNSNIFIKGKIQGLIKLKKGKQNTYTLQGNLKGIRVLVDAYGLKREIPITVDRIDGDIKSTKINISKLKLTSPYFILDGRGNIYLKKNIMDSIISLTGSINLNLKNIKKDLISFPFNNKSRVKYSIHGTLGSLKYKIR